MIKNFVDIFNEDYYSRHLVIENTVCITPEIMYDIKAIIIPMDPSAFWNQAQCNTSSHSGSQVGWLLSPEAQRAWCMKKMLWSTSTWGHGGV